MSAAKHTPGPWVVGPVDDTVVTHLGKDGVRYEVAAIDGDYNEPDEWPVMEANARLIAAAPDLLAALKLMVDWYGRRDTTSFEANDALLPADKQDGEVVIAMAAIAKAEVGA